MSTFHKIIFGLILLQSNEVFSQGKIIVNGAKINVVNSAYVVTGDVSLTNTSTINLNNSTIKISGSINNNSGIFDVTQGTVEMNGIAPQIIPFRAFISNKIMNLIISNAVSLAGQDSITGVLSFGGSNRTFTTNDSLTLKSTAVATASLADITNEGVDTGNTVTGKVTVERHLSARKAWRLLSVPTKTTRNIWESWQESSGANLNGVPGYGTQVTGPGGIAGGFDVNTAASSMTAYAPLTSSWVNAGNTKGTNIKTTMGYMVFVRGDRSVITAFAAPTPTVLRTKGDLYLGTQGMITVGAGRFAAIGNPYASIVDMRHIDKTGMKDFFYLWDPKLAGTNGYGAYQTFYFNGTGYSVIPGLGSYGVMGSTSNYIQSGQAFLIQADSLASGSVTFAESAKAGSTNGVVSIMAGPSQEQLFMSLNGINTDKTTYPADGAVLMYDDGYSNKVDVLDAIKLPNTGENLGIKTANTLLVIERRRTIVQNDTTFLNLTNMRTQKYNFNFEANLESQPGLIGILEDTYLHTQRILNLNGNTLVDFDITAVAASYAANRFRIVFSQLSVLPVTFTSIKAYPKEKNIILEWNVENESNLKTYDVEKSPDGNNFKTAATTAAKNAPSSNYQWIDENPSEGYNYYRVMSTDINGKTAYSTVVKVNVGSSKQNMSVYPNPIVNGVINLQLTNQPAGEYAIRLFNQMGQLMLSKQFTYTTGSSIEIIQLSKYLTHDIYQLEVTLPDNTKTNIKILLQ